MFGGNMPCHTQMAFMFVILFRHMPKNCVGNQKFCLMVENVRYEDFPEGFYIFFFVISNHKTEFTLDRARQDLKLHLRKGDSYNPRTDFWKFTSKFMIF